METNLFIKSAKVDNNKISDINFYGDWEIDLGGGGSGEIQVSGGKPFITDTQDSAVSIDSIKTSSFSIKRANREINAGKSFYYIEGIKTKSDNYYFTYTRLESTYYNYRVKKFNHKPADIDNVIYMFFTKDGDYIRGYKFTGKYLQSLM